MPWSPIDRLRFVGVQFALWKTHYRDHEAVADRWIVTQREVAIGRLYVRRQPRWWTLFEIALKSAVQGGGIGAALIGWVAEAAADARAGVEL